MIKKYELIITGQNNHYSACLPELGIGGSGATKFQAMSELAYLYSDYIKDVPDYESGCAALDRASERISNMTVEERIDLNNLYQPDWSKAPEWAMYHAVDEGGARWWYEEEPFIIKGYGRWCSSHLQMEWYSHGENKCSDWTKSLTKRP